MQSDKTITVGDLINMFTKANLLQDDKLTLIELLSVVEKYHASCDGVRLSEKLADEHFKAHLKSNSAMLKINCEVAARREYMAKCAEAEKEGRDVAEVEPVVDEIPEDVRREREEQETAELREKWVSEIVSQHLMFVKGAELIFQEYREVIFELASKLREKVDPKTGKMMVVLRKFVEDWFLRRLQSFVKFAIPAVAPQGKEAQRNWPESEKDAVIREKRRQIELEREQERLRAEERERVEAEQKLMSAEDSPALDLAEIEELRRKAFEEEEAARIAREAAEEAAQQAELDADQESSEPEDSEVASDDDY